MFAHDATAIAEKYICKIIKEAEGPEPILSIEEAKKQPSCDAGCQTKPFKVLEKLPILTPEFNLRIIAAL